MSSRSVRQVLTASEHLVGICDEYNGRIIVCDLAVEDWTENRAVVWEYKHPNCRSVCGLKLRYSEDFRQPVVLYCYGGGAAIVSYETKEELFHVSRPGRNPHSVELLPEGHLIVASSTGNEVRIYPRSSVLSGEGAESCRIEFNNAHGVLWDPKYNVVWISGWDRLQAFSVAGNPDYPQLVPVPGMDYRTPKRGLHDLAPCYGRTDALFVTCNAGILLFDKGSGTFSSDYPGGDVGKEISYAPGAGNFAGDGVLVYTSITPSTRVVNDYSTDTVFVYVPETGTLLSRRAEDVAFYKVRVWNPNYQ